QDPREKQFAQLGARYTDSILSGNYQSADDKPEKVVPIQIVKYPPASKNIGRIILGTTTVRVKPNARIKIQVDRVIRDWLESQNVKSAPWQYSRQYLVHSHEGEKAEEILKLTNATIIPVWGTKMKKIGDAWYAPDADGIYRFEVSEDKV